MTQSAMARYPRSADSETASAKVPKFLLPGERPQKQENWLVHIKHIAERCRLRGRWQIEPHAHPDVDQLMFIRSGRGVINLDERSVPFESPFALVLPSGCVHGFDYEVDTDGWVLAIEATYLVQINARLPDFKQLWTLPRAIPLVRDSDESAEFHSTLRRLEREVEAKAAGYVVIAESLLASLFVMLLRCTRLDESDKEAATRNETKLTDRFRELIDRHHRQDWQVHDYASAMAVSLVQLRAACLTATGQTPIKMIHARLVTEAKRNLIFGDMSVEQIAYWLGFSDAAYFARFFKKEVGQSPSQFRMIARSQPQHTQ